MANLRSFRLPFILLLSAAGLLGGCCANNVCDPDDPLADAIKLRFSRNFLVTDLDTIIIQRFPKKFTATTRPETVTLIRTPAQAYDSVLLNNSTPFARVGSTTLGEYRFVVQYLAHPTSSKPVTTNALVLDSLRVRGSFEGNGCCTNYTNLEKTAFVQGAAYDLKQLPALTVPK